MVKSEKRLGGDYVPTAIVWRDNTYPYFWDLQGGVRVIAYSNAPFGEALILPDGAWQIAGSLNLEKIKHLLKFELVNDRDKLLQIISCP